MVNNSYNFEINMYSKSIEKDLSNYYSYANTIVPFEYQMQGEIKTENNIIECSTF